MGYLGKARVEMKEGRGILVISRDRAMASVSPSAAYPSPAMAVPTPSPFSFSVASTRWSSSRPSIHIASLFLRGMVLVFSFASSLALATTMTNKKPTTMTNNEPDEHERSFHKYPEFVYSFVVTTLVFCYSAYQLFKGICDIAYRGNLITEKTSDYITFTLDYLAGFLLVSSSSVTTLAIHLHLDENTALKKATIVSVFMSVAAFSIIAVCAILSGYKLSKRIMW